ncbi:MAG TPA: GAF domain-containing protein [Anaerolineales bacterium]|nr:GAF domain-containing protein [Anaerolineales bacterium]
MTQIKSIVQQINSQRWRQNINHLLDAVDKVAGYPDIKEIFQTTAIKMVYLLHAEISVVSVWDPDQDRIVPEAFHTAGSWRLPSSWFKPQPSVGHPLFERVRANARSVQFNLGGMSLPLSTMRLMEEHRIQSWITFPLIGSDQSILGLVDVLDSREPRRFQDDEIALGELLAKLASIAFQRATLDASNRARAGQVAAMADLVALLAELPPELSSDEILEALMRALTEAVGASFSLLSLYNGEKDCLEVIRTRNNSDRDIPEVFFKPRSLDRYPQHGRVLRENRIIRFGLDERDLSPDEREALIASRGTTVWLIPMEAEGEVMGVVEAVSGARQNFPGTEGERVLRILAGLALRALQLSGSGDLTQQPVQFSRALVDAARLMNRSLNMSEVLVQIMEQTMAVMGCTTANLMLIEGDRARVVEHRGYHLRVQSLGPLTNMDLAVTIPTLAEMLRTRQPILLPDIQKVDWWVPIPGGDWIRSYAGAPLMADGEVIGFLNLDSESPGTFDASVTRQMEAFASIAASVLQNARKFKNIQDRVSELEIVRQATLSLTASLNLEELLATILRRSLDLFTGPCDAHIFLYHGGKLTFGAAMYGDGTAGEVWAEPREEGLTYTVARSGLPIIVDDMRQHPLFRNTPDDWTGSIIGLPLKYGDTVVGVMNLAHQTSYEFKEQQIRILNLLADQAAISIVNARLHHLVQEQSMTDMLTGLHNRRSFNNRIDEEVQRSDRYGHTFSLAMMDLNRFKSINDNYGHPTGDQVLIRISRCLSDRVRNTDFLARYGGDEFALIMPETPRPVAEGIALRLQRALEECEFGLASRSAAPITISIGIGQYPSDARNTKDLVAAADKDLYRVKSLWRKSES